MEIIKTNSPEYRQAIIDLYIEAFSTGMSKQYIDSELLNQYIDRILKIGYALISIDNGNINGAAMICPLSMDKDLPEAISSQYKPEKCLYIAEMMVTASARGKGIGQKLMEAFEETADKTHFTDTFIRVWMENIPAINLYKKMGFQQIAEIEQTKTKADKSGTFVMQKIYLHKKLN
jgi:diamine N-acetyltransferase